MILEQKKTAVKAAVTGVSNLPVSVSRPIVSGEWGAGRHLVDSDTPRTDHQGEGSGMHAASRTPRDHSLPGCSGGEGCRTPRSPVSGEGHRDRRIVPGLIWMRCSGRFRSVTECYS